jgi:protein-S-isoprenylcysteine O-methyltransferase Ste14
MDHTRGVAAPRTSPSVAHLAVASSGAAVFLISLGWFVYAYGYQFARHVPSGPVFGPIALDVVLFSVFALHHSAFARTPVKAWVRRAAPPSLERSIYTWMASLLFLLVCWGWQPVPGHLYSLHAPWRWLAYTAQAMGIVLTVLGSRALDVLDLAGIRPVLRAGSGGAPAHVPLTTTGVFGIVRHPLYFGWALMVLGAPDMTATRAVFAIVSTAYLVMAISWEERGLVGTFGGEYEDYRRRVRWKMVPFLY